MRTVVIDRFGGPEVLSLRDVATPEPGPDEVLVKVIAAGVNPVDAKVRAGGHWAGIELPAVIGYDASGVIERVGSCLHDLQPGQDVFYTPEVFGNRHGSYAQYEPVPAALVAPKPAALSHVEAAAIPLAGGTAWEAIFRRLAVRVGETVLIHRCLGRLLELAQLFERGQARVLIERVLPLEQVGEAHRRLDSGHGWGKIVLQVA